MEEYTQMWITEWVHVQGMQGAEAVPSSMYFEVQVEAKEPEGSCLWDALKVEPYCIGMERQRLSPIRTEHLQCHWWWLVAMATCLRFVLKECCMWMPWSWRQRTWQTSLAEFSQGLRLRLTRSLNGAIQCWTGVPASLQYAQRRST